MKKILLLTLLASSFNLTPAYAIKDVKGSSDHPLLGRYPGFFIKTYNQSEYDEAEILTGPYNKNKKKRLPRSSKGKSPT